MKLTPKVGDQVTIHAALCEWDGMDGEIIAIGADDETLPYMVRRSDFFEWPFALHELELRSIEVDDVYEGGWVDPREEQHSAPGRGAGTIEG